MFSHVKVLNLLGFPAAVVYPDRAALPPWIEADVPVLFRSDAIVISERDFVVLPEVFSTTDQAWRLSATRVLFCQNHFLMLHGLSGVRSWFDVGCRNAMACSQVVADALKLCFAFDDVPVIRCTVDRTVFRPAAKRLQVCCIASKMLEEANLIYGFFRQLYPEYANVPWVGLQNVSRRDVANTMGVSSVFLSLNRREGLGLPPLEAMACNCLVTGFAGIGGKEYATPENGLWCEEEDLLGCAVKVGQALKLAEHGGPALRRYLAQGARTVERFSVEGMRSDLSRYWSEMMDR